MISILEERLIVYIVLIFTISIWYTIYIINSKQLSIGLKLYIELKVLIISIILIGMILFTYQYISI